MSDRGTTRRRTAAAAALVMATVVVVVAIGYPDWLWFPLFIGFWGAVLALLVSAGLEARSRLMRT